MKKTLFFVAFFLLNYILLAQNPFLDATFGQGGSIIYNMNGTSVDCRLDHAVIQSSGKIVAIGSAEVNGGTKAIAVRFLTDGTQDSTFGVSGEWISSDANFLIANDVLVQPDDKILITGWGGGFAKTVRLLPDGDYDTSFGSGGKSNVTIWSGGSTIMIDLALQQDGKILVSGYKNPESAVIRLKSDGKPDSTFGTLGKVIIHQNFFNPPASSIYGLKIGVNADNSVLVSGVYTPPSGSLSGFVARFKSNGVLDATFGTNGFSTIPFVEQQILDLFELPNGEFLVLCDVRRTAFAKPRTSLLKWTADGHLDANYANQGYAQLPVGAEGTYSQNGYMQSDGKVLVFGINFFDGSQNQGMCRFNIDGSMDASFGQAGFYSPNPPVGFSDGCVQSDGKIVVATSFMDSVSHIAAQLRRYIDNSMVNTLEPFGKLRNAEIYPNPVGSDLIHLKYNLQEDSPVQVELLDLQGRPIYRFFNAEHSSGDVEETFKLPPSLKNGLYWLSIQTPARRAVLKLSILR